MNKVEEESGRYKIWDKIRGVVSWRSGSEFVNDDLFKENKVWKKRNIATALQTDKEVDSFKKKEVQIIEELAGDL